MNLAAIMAGAANIPAFRSMRTLRALRPLRAVSRWEGMRVSNKLRCVILYTQTTGAPTTFGVQPLHMLPVHVECRVQWNDRELLDAASCFFCRL